MSGWSGWNLTHVSPWVLQVTYADAYRDYGAMERALAAVRRTILHNVKAPDLNSSVAAEVCQFRRVGKGGRQIAHSTPCHVVRAPLLYC